MFPTDNYLLLFENGGHFQLSSLVEMLYLCSYNGMINKDFFVTWHNHFKNKLNPSIKDRILIYLS